jgi:hypothetical protein
MLSSVRASIQRGLARSRLLLRTQFLALGSQPLLARQIRHRSTYRLLVAYSVGVAITCSLWLAFCTNWGRGDASGGLLIAAAGGSDAIVRSFAIDVLNVAVLGISVVGGGMLISGPVPTRPCELIVELTRRLVPLAERRIEVHPVVGGLLLARVGVILPLWLGITVLLAERQLAQGWETLLLCLRLAAAVVLVLGVIGAGATWLSRKHLRHPILVWTALWIIPELAHLAHSSFPTPYRASKTLVTVAASLRAPK